MIVSTIIISILLSTASSETLLQEAQTNLIQEQWKEAATILDELARSANASPEVMYDRGIAHYNLGQFDIASLAFEDAMSTSENQKLRTHSAFNYGNSIFQKTMQELEGTGTATTSDEAIAALKKAKDQISLSLQSYRRAIAENNNDTDARANGEFAWKLLQQLNQMQEQMEEQQQQQQEQEKQEQQQDEESAKEQEEDQENKEQGDSEQEQDQQGEQSEQQEQGEQSEQDQEGEQSEQQEQGEQSEQQEQGEQSEQQEQGEQSEQQEQGEQSEQQEQGEQSEQQEQGEQFEQQEQGEQFEQDQQGEQSEQQEQGEQSEQKEQNIKDGELKSSQEKSGETDVPQASKKEEGKRLSKEEAIRLLQLIRDKEQQRRKALAAKRAAKRVPVEKDW